MAHLEQVERDLKALAKFVKKLGELNDDGKYVVKFGILFDDDEAANTFEAMNGTLRAAKKRGIIDFKGQMLLKGPHDNVPITLLVAVDDNEEEAAEEENGNESENENNNEDNNENNVETATEKDTNEQKNGGIDYSAPPTNVFKDFKLKAKPKPTPTILPKSYSPSPSPGPQMSLVESVASPAIEQDAVAIEEPEPEEEQLENKWGEEFTSKLGKCINEIFEYDEESILPAKYLLHYLKKRIGFDFSGQTKHRDALQFVCVEQFGWKTINDWGYSIRVV